MTKIKLGTILFEQKETVKSQDGDGLDLIGVSNEIGLHISRAKRINNLSRYKYIHDGWFAYNPMRVNVGSIGYANTTEHLGIVSPDYVVFSCSEKILPEYLLYLLKSDEGIEAINKNASGAVRKRLYFRDLAQIEIVLPSIDTQKQRISIFKKVEGLKASIMENKGKEGLVSQLKQGILQEAIEGKLTKEWRKTNGAATEHASVLLERIKAEKAQLVADKKIKKEKPLPPIAPEEVPFEIPEGWVWCRLGETVELLSGQDFDKSKFSEHSGKGIPYITGSSNIKNENIIFNRWTTEPRSIALLGDLIITCKGTVGKMAFLKVQNAHIARQLMAIRKGQIHLTYVQSFLKTKLNLFRDKAKSLIPGIDRTTMLNVIIPLPPLSEQIAIVEKVEGLMEKCHLLEDEIAGSEAHAHMLMQAVLKEAFASETELVAG